MYNVASTFGNKREYILFKGSGKISHLNALKKIVTCWEVF